jgi:transglutaminase-like putative cysteine protease
MARTLGIPTRVVNGVVYSDRYQGFLYHSWNECLVENRWLSVDPIWGQVPADVTHLKLIEGHALQELAPLMGIIGKLSIQIQSAH